MIATPEYNGFVTPLLLNMLCWASRPSPGDDFGSVFQARPVALMASSPGRLGGVRVIPRLRDVLAELGMVPVPGCYGPGSRISLYQPRKSGRRNGRDRPCRARGQAARRKPAKMTFKQ